MRAAFPLLSLIPFVLMAPGAALAGPLDGEWDESYEACMDDASFTRFSISEGTMGFSEGICSLANEVAVPGLPNAWVYDMTCDNDIQVTTEKALLALTLGGMQLTVIGLDSAYTSERCP